VQDQAMSEHLLRHARDESSEGRRELLSAVTDLFVSADNPSTAARHDYAVIAAHALNGLDMPDRAAYAQRVAALPTLPHGIARRLAADEEIEIAGVVLRLSPVLTDEDLAEIALTHSQGHLIAMAERSAISEIATQVLVDRGGDAVLRLLASHRNARFTPGARARLAQRVLKIAVEIADQGDSLRARTARERLIEIRALIADVTAQRRALDDVVSLVARQDRAVDLATLLATFADRSIGDALKALFAREDGMIREWADHLGLATEARDEIAELRAARFKRQPRSNGDDAT
jgi:uncharacterized protein (DUF2336 family)